MPASMPIASAISRPRYMQSNGGPAMAPWGGMKKIVGTNPLSVATPAGRHAPFVVDMANTGVARGKIYLARQKRQPIPPGWAKSNCGHLIALNIEAMQPLAAFNKRMEEYIAELKAVPRAQGFDEVFYPGEIEARNDARNRSEGIEFPDDAIAGLKRIAKETGLEGILPC